MMRGLFLSVHSSMNAASRISDWGLCVEKVSPTMLDFMSEIGTSRVEMMLATECTSETVKWSINGSFRINLTCP